MKKKLTILVALFLFAAVCLTVLTRRGIDPLAFLHTPNDASVVWRYNLPNLIKVPITLLGLVIAFSLFSGNHDKPAKQAKASGKHSLSHRTRALLAGLLAFAAAFGAFMIGVALMMPNDRLLSRFLPDAAVNTGFIEPETLQKEMWTTMEQTEYKNGEPASQTKFRRAFLTHHTVTHTPVGGEPVVWSGITNGEGYEREYLGREPADDALYLTADYSCDLAGRIDSVSIHAVSADRKEDETLNHLIFEYYDYSRDLCRQVKPEYTAGANGYRAAGYRTFSYYNDKISSTNDYDKEDQFIAYTEYSYGETSRTTKTYGKDNVLLASSYTEYDWFGRILHREHYDADGELTSTEVYHYRFWERFYSFEGIAAAIMILSFSVTTGGGVYQHFLKKAVMNDTPLV